MTSLDSGRERIAMVIGDTGIPVLGDKGAAVHVRAIAHALRTHGHDVTVFAARTGRNADVEFDVPVREVVLPSEIAAWTRFGSAVTSDAPELDELRRILLGKAIRDAILAEHRARPFTLVYERLSLWSAAGATVAAEIEQPYLVEANARLISEQTTYRSLALPRLAVAIEQTILRDAGALLPVSRAVATALIEAGASATRIHVIPNGVDPAQFHPDLDGSWNRAAWGVKPGEIVAGFTGSMKPWHGLQDVIRAIARTRRRDICLVAAGEGPVRSECIALAESLGVRAVFPGALPHHAIPAVVAGFDIALTPCAVNADPYFSPLKAFEYAGSGRAIVSSSGGQVEELFPADAVRFYTPGDIPALASLINALADDPAARRTMGSAARDFVAEHHTWSANAAAILRIARQLRAEGAVSCAA